MATRILSPNALNRQADNPFDLLTDLERAEYDAWCEEVNAQTPLPTLCKCGKIHGDYSHPEGDYDLCEDCQDALHIPFDSESDYDPDIPFLDEPISTDNLDDILVVEMSTYHRCDCGQVHNSTLFLNASTGNYLCKPCIRQHDEKEAEKKLSFDLALQEELERFRNAPIWKPRLRRGY